jgi:hypothetical protein
MQDLLLFFFISSIYYLANRLFIYHIKVLFFNSFSTLY